MKKAQEKQTAEDVAQRGFLRVLSLLPPALEAELYALLESRNAFFAQIEELRLRANGRCSAVLFGRQTLLLSTVSAAEMDALVLRLCGGSLYAYEECIAEGYIPMEHGVRVGICGRARYEGEILRGVCEVRSLVFRFPHAAHSALVSAAAEAFFRAERGLLILSSPGVGKTTALRALALRLGTGSAPRRVVVVDERMEFMPEEYEEATVDLLRGYRRVLGLQIAQRCFNPEVVMMDEIGGTQEAREMAALLRAGAKAVATAHAGDLSDIYMRGALSPFMERGVFDAFLFIKREETGLAFEFGKMENGEVKPSLCYGI